MGLILDSFARVCRLPGRSRRTNRAMWFWCDIGPTHRGTRMLGNSQQATLFDRMSSAEDSLAHKPLSQQRSTEREVDWMAKTVACGTKCCESCECFALSGSSLKTLAVPRRGLPKSRAVWRSLATQCADLTSRLGVLVRRIYAGECSGLPTLTARDWRSPGSASHARLQSPRGEPLTETLDCRLSPEFAEWMMGFPRGWTDVSESSNAATLSCPPLLSGSESKS